MRCGKAAGRREIFSCVSAILRSEFGRLDLVGLGQHDLVDEPGRLDPASSSASSVLEDVPGIYQPILLSARLTRPRRKSWISLVQALTFLSLTAA